MYNNVNLSYSTNLSFEVNMLKKFFKKKTTNLKNDPMITYIQQQLESVKKTRSLDQTLEDAIFTVIDTETTGLDLEKDKLINIAAVKVQNFKILDFYDAFINPEMPIPPESIKWHHITDDMVKDKPTVEEVLPEFIRFIGDSVLVGHHVGFDIRMINKDLKLHYGSELYNYWLDTMLIYCKAIIMKDAHVGLDYLFDIYKVKCNGRHTALGDALATAEVFNKMISQAHKNFKTVAELYNSQNTNLTSNNM
jgi:DNA polymerase III epsilon subunit family exonuclease